MRFLTVALLAISIAILAGCSDDESTLNESATKNPLGISNSEATLTLEGDGEYEKVITSPLIKLDDCEYIVAGTIEYFLDGEVVAIIDYGNGECDNIATKTIDGEVYEFKLDEKGEKDEYEKNITNPLVKLEDCDYIVEGTIEYYENDIWVATVDYGDGECDEWATKTTEEGSTVFSLRKDGK